MIKLLKLMIVLFLFIGCGSAEDESYDELGVLPLRFASANIVYKGRIFLICGYQAIDDGDSTVTRAFDILYSSDGIKWHQGPEVPWPYKPFEEEYDIKATITGSIKTPTSIFEYNNKLWVTCKERDKVSVWVSNDGLSWSKVGDLSADLHGLRNVTVYNGLMIGFINKQTLPTGITPPNWSNTNNLAAAISTDGLNWTLYQTNLPDLFGCSVTFFNDKLWLIGGTTYTGFSGSNAYYTTSRSIYSSSNGVNWVLETNDPLFSTRLIHNAVVLNNDFYIVGGISRYTGYRNFNLSDVWKAGDNSLLSWDRKYDASLFGFSGTSYPLTFDGVWDGESMAFAFKNELWVIVRNVLEPYGAGEHIASIYHSPDGTVWTKVQGDPVRFHVH